MFDETIKLYATAADDDHFSDEAEDDDLRSRFGDDDEEEEVTMTSDDDEELDNDEDEILRVTHAEDATIFALPPSPVTSYDPQRGRRNFRCRVSRRRAWQNRCRRR